jgi:hypothetical protein
MRSVRPSIEINLKDDYVVASQADWDTLYYDDLINHEGFRIYEPAVLSLDGRKEKNMHGPNSPLFGTTYGDEQAFMERHRCKCGTFIGRQFLGETCPFCQRKIKKVDLDIKKTGWIHLGDDNVVISPYWYTIFQSLIGKDVFDEIVQRIERVDSDGNRHEVVPDEDHPPRSPFSGIGIDGFYKRYEEILGYYSIKKKNKAESFAKAIENKDKAFIHNIPVYSTFLRPSSVTQDTFYFNGIDKQINTIVNLSISLKDCEDIEKPFIQTRIQERLQKMWRLNFEQISHKKGLIRNKVISGALNYTSRSVITPDATLLPNEVDISYQGFRILFKYQIIACIMQTLNIPLADAYNIWAASYKKDDFVLDIMNYIVKRDQPRILLNRNPTINMYSMLLLKIRKVKPDWRRTTLSIPLYILRGLNADQQTRSGNVVTHVQALCERLTSGVMHSLKNAG